MSFSVFLENFKSLNVIKLNNPVCSNVILFNSHTKNYQENKKYILFVNFNINHK